MDNANERATQSLWQFGTSLRKMRKTDGPLVFERGEGCYIYDTDGRQYIDGLSGVWVVNAGHGQESIVQAMSEQARRLGYALSEEGYANTAAIALAERLVALTGGEMDRAYFTCGGSESVEIALRMARLFHRMNRKPLKVKIIARRGSYHGATLFALTVSAFDIFSKAIGPNPEGVCRVAHPTCYRCEFGATYPSCDVQCADDLERMILSEGPETVAAFIAEPISTSAGVAIPPAEYWQRVRLICDRYDVLLICDEIVTGMGRTGYVLAMQGFGVWPDIVTLAKGLSSGYSPLGAVLTHRSFTEKVPDNAYLIPGFTFTGHPVSCAAALANLDIVTDPDLLDRVRRQGPFLEERLHSALGACRYVGDIRVSGLLACVEIVADRESKEPFAAPDKVAQFLTTYFLNHGLYLRIVENFIQIGPPLVVDTKVLDTLVDVVAAGLAALEDLPALDDLSLAGAT